MECFLVLSHRVQPDTHVFDLLGQGVVDICLTCNLLVALLNFFLGVLVLPGHLSQVVLGLRQLDFDVPQRVLQLLVLHLAQAEHLSVFNFGTLLSFDSEAFSDSYSFELEYIVRICI